MFPVSCVPDGGRRVLRPMRLSNRRRSVVWELSSRTNVIDLFGLSCGDRALSVSVKVVADASGQIIGTEGFDFPGLDVDHAVLVLEATEDTEERFLHDDEAEFLEELGIDDDVGDAGFVFEADEDDAFGGAGTLAANDGPGDSQGLVVREEAEVGGALEVFRQARAENRHGMPTGGHSRVHVIGVNPLSVGHGGEGGRK